MGLLHPPHCRACHQHHCASAIRFPKDDPVPLTDGLSRQDKMKPAEASNLTLLIFWRAGGMAEASMEANINTKPAVPQRIPHPLGTKNGHPALLVRHQTPCEKPSCPHGTIAGMDTATLVLRGHLAPHARTFPASGEGADKAIFPSRLSSVVSQVAPASCFISPATCISKQQFLLQDTAFCHEATVTLALPQKQQHPCGDQLGREDAGKNETAEWAEYATTRSSQLARMTGTSLDPHSDPGSPLDDLHPSARRRIWQRV